MKKFIITGIVILIIGLGVFTCGFAMSGWNIYEMETQSQFEEKTYTSNPNITEIQIEDKNTPVVLRKSSDDKVHITYYENDKTKYNISENGVLIIKKIDNYQWYDYIFKISFQINTLIVEVPESFKGDITANTSNSKINVENLEVNNLTAITSNGSIELSSLKVNENVEAHTSNGAIDIQKTTAAGNLNLNTSNSHIICKETNSADLTAKSSNGRIKLSDVKTENDIFVQTSNGSIETEKIATEKSITLKTSNAGITGTVTGSIADYSIVSHTSNASNNLPEELQGGNKQLNVETSNGRIDIWFE